MVLLTQLLGYATKWKLRKYLRSGFLDSMRIFVKAGTGGEGLPRYGGVGGRGGDVYVVSKEGLTLQAVCSKVRGKKLVAGPGDNSSARGILGAAGEDLFIEVPPGVTVYNENGIRLGEIDQPGSKLIVAKGGLGGRPETGYSGQRGEAHRITLDLKLIADAALVGFPNAGKSTLIRAVSRARPKVASYPFTTMRPHLGIMEYEDLRQISIADLPGLIEGAHVNIGMGHKFLKHVERTKVLVFVVDIQGFQLSPRHEYLNCLETIVLLNKELELYKPDLVDMPAILVVNKMDTEGAQEKYQEIEPMIMRLPDYISECREEIQPEKVINFNVVMKTAVAQRKKEEIDAIKQHIRILLDKYTEETERKDDAMDVELIEKIKRETRQYAPVLV